LLKAVNGGSVDPSQVSEIADSLHQSAMSSDNTAATEPGLKVASSLDDCGGITKKDR
jgi:hypothetical protein